MNDSCPPKPPRQTGKLPRRHPDPQKLRIRPPTPQAPNEANTARAVSGRFTVTANPHSRHIRAGSASDRTRTRTGSSKRQRHTNPPKTPKIRAKPQNRRVSFPNEPKNEPRTTSPASPSHRVPSSPPSCLSSSKRSHRRPTTSRGPTRRDTRAAPAARSKPGSLL